MLWFAATANALSVAVRAMFVLAGCGMLALAALHRNVLRGAALKTSVFFLLESIVLAGAAYLWYSMGLNKSAFLYEGVSIFFLSLAAFSFLLRKKREVLFHNEEEA